MADEGRNQVPAAILRLAKRANAPQALTAVQLRRRFGDLQRIELEAGQLWRARWEDVGLLALLLDVDGSSCWAAPATVDPPVEDGSSVVLAPATTVLGEALTVWAGLARQLPLRVLDQPLDLLASDVVAYVRSVAAGRTGPAPTGCRVGNRIVSVFQAAAEARAELQDDLEALAAASWLPQAHADAQLQPGNTNDLRDLLGDRPDLPALMGALDAPLPEVLDIIRGRRPPTPAQADALAEMTGRPAAALLASVGPLPGELVAEVDHPRWRPVVRRRARRIGRDEARARLELAYGTYALAARQTGPAAAPSWRDRVAQVAAADGDLGHADP
jgi:hypothetical protein